MIRFFRHSLFQQLVLIICIVGLLCLLGNWWGSYNLQNDEGLNLAKAALVDNGYRLYQDIWSDQPPLLTHVLARVHQGFPFSVAAARTTILIFSLLLATSLFRVVLRFEGSFAAWSSVFLLISSELFLKLSVSVMVGLPAIALAMLAVDFATLEKGKNRVLPLLAGVLFGAALLTKMFAMIILPAVMAAFWFTPKEKRQLIPRPSVFRAAWFFGGIAIVGVIVLVGMWGFPFDQLLSPHLSARSSTVFAEVGGPVMLLRMLARYAPLAFYFTIVFGFGAFYMRPTSCLVIPAVWLMVGTVLLSTHHPLWVHQVLILVLPLSWLGGVGLKSLFRSGERLKLVDWILRKVDRRIVLALVVAGCAALIPPISKNVRQIRSYLTDSPDLTEQMARIEAAILTQGADLLITDRPIRAYQAKLLVPPKLAVWSEKRMKTGRLTEEDILTEVAAHPGTPVLLDRFAYNRSFLERISSLADRVETGWDHHGKSGIHVFLPKTVRTPIEAELLSKVPALLDGGIGGVFRADGNSIKRFERPGSKEPLAPNSIVARPPGSAQELGDCFAAAARVTGSKSLLIHALDVGRALYCTQTVSGGWASTAVAADYCGMRRFVRPPDKHATFDDGTMASILHFAFDLSDLIAERGLSAPSWLDDMISNGLSFIIKAQSADGSWMQQYQTRKYHQLATLNDDAMTGLIRILLVGYARMGRPEYLAAAKRGGDFLLRAQDNGDKPAFAQQYSSLLKPASARKFEPAGYSSLETAYAINALIDLYLSTGNEHYRNGAEKAAAWLDASRITATTWARLYEVGSNRPIFGKRDGTVTYDIADLPESERRTYRWTGGRETFPDIGVALDRISKLKEGSDALRAYDARFRRKALLSATPTARIWLDPGQAKQDLGGRPSTRAFVEYCAGLLAAFGEEVSTCPSGGQKQRPGGM